MAGNELLEGALVVAGGEALELHAEPRERVADERYGDAEAVEAHLGALGRDDLVCGCGDGVRRLGDPRDVRERSLAAIAQRVDRAAQRVRGRVIDAEPVNAKHDAVEPRRPRERVDEIGQFL